MIQSLYTHSSYAAMLLAAYIRVRHCGRKNAQQEACYDDEEVRLALEVSRAIFNPKTDKFSTYVSVELRALIAEWSKSKQLADIEFDLDLYIQHFQKVTERY